MRKLSVIVFVAAVLIGQPATATSVRTIHPELVGFREVALNFSPQTVPGLDTDALEDQIRDRINDSGLVIDNEARTTLFVQIKYRLLPACPGFLLIQTHVAISEEVEVKRADRSVTVYVDTWRTNEEFFEPVSEAAEVASASTLGIINYLLDAREYTASVIAAGK